MRLMNEVFWVGGLAGMEVGGEVVDAGDEGGIGKFVVVFGWLGLDWIDLLVLLLWFLERGLEGLVDRLGLDGKSMRKGGFVGR